MGEKQALRPYQEAARKSIHTEWENGRLRTLLVLPTGTGKTIVFASVAADQVRAGDRVLILAHRGELLEQAADKLQRSTGLVSAVEKAESTCLDSWYRVVVGSVQTLQRPARLERFPRDYFGTIIIDEAHHSITDGYRRILDYFGSAKVLGVTATPDRGDMRNLGEVFDSLAYEYKLTDAIKDGYLCRIMAQTVPLKLDISAVGMSSGDYSVGELGTALDPYLSQIAEEMAARCAGRKTVVFLPLIKTSQKFRDLLNAKGFRAAEVNGQSADRRQVLSDFESDKYNVLCNSMLLTEGKTKVNDRVYFPDHLTMVTEVDGCDDYPASRMTIFIESACVRFLYEQDCDSELDEDIYLGLRRKAYEQKDRELLERIVENSKKSESLD